MKAARSEAFGIDLESTQRKKRTALVRTRMLNVLDAIQRDILHCVLKPGAKLPLKDLRQRYECGLSPLREALMRLVAEGLVVLEDRKGFCVAPVSTEEVVDLTNIRCELEAFAIRKAIEHGDDQWEGSLLARAHELSKRSMTATDGTIDEEWENRHKAFYQALYASCGSPWLLRLFSLLFDRSRRYRRLTVDHNRAGRDVMKEHNDLVKAALDRDSVRAEKLIREHLSLTTELILACSSQKPAISKKIEWDPSGAPLRGTLDGLITELKPR